MRSEQGKGEAVAIYSLQPSDGDDLDVYEAKFGKGSAGWHSIGEDYAKSSYPVTVKVKAGITKEEFLQVLSDLQKAVKKGSFTEREELEKFDVSTGQRSEGPASTLENRLENIISNLRSFNIPDQGIMGIIGEAVLRYFTEKIDTEIPF